MPQQPTVSVCLRPTSRFQGICRFAAAAWRFASVGLLLAMFAPTVAMGQLTILSRGDTDQKWREAQVALLQQQLASGTVKGELKQELEEQLKWLSKWSPGKLTDGPLLPSEKPAERLVEPILDPEKSASKLRERLFGENAKPTSRDTQQLEKALSENPGDVGIRQLHLHWLDQKQYRKIYPDEIAEAAIRLVGLLDQLKPQTPEVQRAKAYCLYRRGRALAYRELPEVVAEKPIDDEARHEAELLGAYAQLTSLAGAGRPEFILLDIRMLRRDHWYGRALSLLEQHGEVIERQWFMKKRRDLLKELNWEKPAAEANALYVAAFPDAADSDTDSDAD